MIEVALSYRYTADHRYDSDLDEKVEEALAKLVERAGGEMDGSAGGMFMGAMPDDLAADCSFYLKLPDVAAAERIATEITPLLRFYDERYRATVRTYDTDGTGTDSDDIGNDSGEGTL